MQTSLLLNPETYVFFTLDDRAPGEKKSLNRWPSDPMKIILNCFMLSAVTASFLINELRKFLWN